MLRTPDRWRQLWHKEQPLVRELALMLLMAVVVGIYFLKHTEALIEQEQRRAGEALASQLATASAEYLASGNLLSLNVMAQQTAMLDGVGRVEIRNRQDGIVASAGAEQPAGLSVSQPVRLEELVNGRVLLWLPVASAERAAPLEHRFVLLVLALLLLRLVIEFAWRRLQAEPVEPEEDAELLDADLLPVLTMNQTSEAPRAWLRVAIVNFDRLQARCTRDMLEQMVAGYAQLLRQVAAVYGARLVAPLGGQAELLIQSDSRGDACFQALCAGTLFRRLARELSEQRKESERVALEFKLLATTNGNSAESWSLCLAGLPGRVHVLETDMQRYELDTRLLFQGERCLNVLLEDRTERLQPIEQLAQRYQKLIAEQATHLSETA